jgi:hypothetical protein
VCSANGCKKAYYHSRSLKKHERTHAGHETGGQVLPNNNNTNGNIGYIPTPLDAAQAGAYARYDQRPSPYIPTPYNPPSMSSSEKMNETQAAYLAQREQQQAVSQQLGQMAPMNAYGQSPGGQIYSPLVAMKYNMPDAQSSTPGQQIQNPIPPPAYSSNSTPTGVPQPAQAYAYAPPPTSAPPMQQQQPTAYPPHSHVPNPANVASQFNYGQ